MSAQKIARKIVHPGKPGQNFQICLKKVIALTVPLKQLTEYGKWFKMVQWQGYYEK